MLPRSLRIDRQILGNILKNKGLSIHQPHFSLSIYKENLSNPPSVLPRCAVIVSKKTAPRAVKRNLIRRRVYRFLSQNLAQYKEKKMFWVFFAKKEAEKLSLEQTYQEIKNLISKVK